jgi:hypothetical protein
MRVSKADGSQVLDLQRDALVANGVAERSVYSDTARARRTIGQASTPASSRCAPATPLLSGSSTASDNLRHLVNVVHDLNARGVGLRVLTGKGAAIDTTTAAGKLVRPARQRGGARKGTKWTLLANVHAPGSTHYQ